MARRRRDTEAGLFHVWAHSVWSADLFADDLDRARGVSELARATQRQPWVCLAAVLMTTHYHLILDVEDDALPLGMQALNFRYAAGYNARHRLRGHVFSGRYGSRRLKTEADLLDTYRYVVWNPVRAGLCTRPAQDCARGPRTGGGAATPPRSAATSPSPSSRRTACSNSSDSRASGRPPACGCS
jgi:putative transposase